MSAHGWLSVLDEEILLALIWSGPYLTAQLGQILAAHWSFRQLQRRLAYLEERALVEGGFFYRRDRRRRLPPARVGRVWSVTARGVDAIAGHDRAPFAPTRERRDTLLDHDTTASAVIAHIIAHTRPVLSGLAVFREMRVDDRRTAPIADTIVVVRTRHAAVDGHALPWSRQGVQPGESLRAVAIESDRATEELSVIADKARNYQRLAGDADYLARYAGVLPAPLWIAPTSRRAESIHVVCQRTWPEGTWLSTSDEAMRHDRFVEHCAGRVRRRTWLDDWEIRPADEAEGTT
jgi:hypothetical protein